MKAFYQFTENDALTSTFIDVTDGSYTETKYAYKAVGSQITIEGQSPAEATINGHELVLQSLPDAKYKSRIVLHRTNADEITAATAGLNRKASGSDYDGRSKFDFSFTGDGIGPINVSEEVVDTISNDDDKTYVGCQLDKKSKLSIYSSRSNADKKSDFFTSLTIEDFKATQTDEFANRKISAKTYPLFSSKKLETENSTGVLVSGGVLSSQATCDYDLSLKKSRLSGTVSCSPLEMFTKDHKPLKGKVTGSFECHLYVEGVDLSYGDSKK